MFSSSSPLKTLLRARFSEEVSVDRWGFEPQTFNVAWHLKREGYADTTIKGITRKLKYLGRQVSLDNPEAVKQVIACKKGSGSYKEALVNAYNHYAKVNGFTWNKPTYHRERSLPYVATREEIAKIVSRSSRKYALIFSVMVDTGLRPIEIHNLQLKHIDLNRGTITAPSCKHGNPRLLKLKSSTLAMLREYLDLRGCVFPSPGAIRHAFERVRNNVAEKLHEPSLKKIRPYDLRHHFATMLYHRTKDILFVQRQLGHKRLANTLVYTHLLDVDAIEFTCRVARTVSEASKLVEAGFEYVCDVDGVQLFRKPK